MVARIPSEIVLPIYSVSAIAIIHTNQYYSPILLDMGSKGNKPSYPVFCWLKMPSAVLVVNVLRFVVYGETCPTLLMRLWS